MLADAADQAGVGERRADGAGADDGDLRGGHASSWQPAPSEDRDRCGPHGRPALRGPPPTGSHRDRGRSATARAQLGKAGHARLTQCLPSSRWGDEGAEGSRALSWRPAWRVGCWVWASRQRTRPTTTRGRGRASARSCRRRRSRSRTRPVPAPVPAPEPGQPPAPAVEPPPPPPPPPPVLDPVSGHLYDPRGPRPTCARHVWSINGSIGDSWGFVLRNCTSFVSWRLHERNGMAGFDNHFRGEHWGNAANWDDVARRLGYRVDSVPAIGAVAQTDAGRVGHVAWVSDIGPGHRDDRGVQLRLRRWLRHPHGPGRRLPLPAPRRRRPLPARRLGPARRVGARRTRRVVDRARRRPRDPAPDRPRPTGAGGRSPRAPSPRWWHPR